MLKLLCLLLCFLGSIEGVRISNFGLTLVDTKKPIIDPIVDMMVNDNHVTGSYYDINLKSADYQNEIEKIDTDSPFFEKVTQFAKDLANDIVMNEDYMLIIAPKYTAKFTAMITKFISKYNKEVRNGAPKFKKGFLTDSVNIWTSIFNNWLKDPELKSRIRSEVPKDQYNFIYKYVRLVDILYAVALYSPVGPYVHWSQLEIDGKSIAEKMAPFVLYLQENGHKTAVATLKMIMSMIAKMKSCEECER